MSRGAGGKPRAAMGGGGGGSAFAALFGGVADKVEDLEKATTK